MFSFVLKSSFYYLFHRMDISNLKPNNPVKDLKVKITSRLMEKDTKAGKLETATITDDTGSATLNLWQNECGTYKKGQIIQIKNGWCKEYQGRLQVSTGRYGEINLVKDADPGQEKQDEEGTVRCMRPRLNHRPTICRLRGWMRKKKYIKEVAE